MDVCQGIERPPIDSERVRAPATHGLNDIGVDTGQEQFHCPPIRKAWPVTLGMLRRAQKPLQRHRKTCLIRGLWPFDALNT